MDGSRKVLNARERAVLEAATARLIPGPDDDPAEAGSPGAREAGAADYIGALLGALRTDPPRVYAGGPFSDRAGSDRNDMAEFLPLSETTTGYWQERLDQLVAAYREGLAELDSLAGGDFAAASPAEQDEALAQNPTVPHLPHSYGGFTELLFEHTIEGCYSAPEYGGNRNGVMWESIGFPGDAQPRGYTAEQVTESDGPDPCDRSPIVTDLMNMFGSNTPAPVAGSGAGSVAGTGQGRA